jgi:hypothetical protein
LYPHDSLFPPLRIAAYQILLVGSNRFFGNPPLSCRVLRNLFASLRRYICSALLAAQAAERCSGRFYLVASVVILARCNFADYCGNANGVGWSLLPVGTVGH